MSNNTQLESKLSFSNYIVDYVNFRENREYDKTQVKIDFKVSKDVNYDENDNSIAYVSLIINIFENAEENNYPFSMDLSLTGRFKIDAATDDALRTHFIEKNAITILFPYARALVTTFTSNCNMPPLILPPVNINNMFDN